MIASFKLSSSWIKDDFSDMSFEKQYELSFEISRQVGIENPSRLTWLGFGKTNLFVGDTKLEIDKDEDYVESSLTEEEQITLQKNLDTLAIHSSSQSEKSNALNQVYKIYQNHLTDKMIQHITNSIDRDIIAGREFLAVGGHGKLPVGAIYSLVNDFYERSQTFNAKEPYKDFSSSLFTYPIIAN